MACTRPKSLSFSPSLSLTHVWVRAILKINIFRNPLGVATLIHNDETEKKTRMSKYIQHTGWLAGWLLSSIEYGAHRFYIKGLQRQSRSLFSSQPWWRRGRRQRQPRRQQRGRDVNEEYDKYKLRKNDFCLCCSVSHLNRFHSHTVQRCTRSVHMCVYILPYSIPLAAPIDGKNK